MVCICNEIMGKGAPLVTTCIGHLRCNGEGGGEYRQDLPFGHPTQGQSRTLG